MFPPMGAVCHKYLELIKFTGSIFLASEKMKNMFKGYLNLPWLIFHLHLQNITEQKLVLRIYQFNNFLLCLGVNPKERKKRYLLSPWTKYLLKQSHD
jgi:hypothetical protein